MLSPAGILSMAAGSFRLRQLWSLCFLSVLSFFWIVCADMESSRSATLTVENGVDLAGSHCPGETVTLFCEGMALPSMRWRFGNRLDAENLHVISAVHGQSNNSSPDIEFPAVFMNVNFLYLQDRSFSNLTIELFELSKLKVTYITCGSPSTYDTLNISVTSRRINPPIVTNVYVTYQDGLLTNVRVKWTKVLPVCGAEISYTVDLAGSSYSQSGVGCDPEENLVCAEFDGNFSSAGSERYELVVTAQEGNNISASVTYPGIYYWRDHYFTLELNLTTCSPTVECIPFKNLGKNTHCIIQYTKDAQYRSLSNPIRARLNTTETLPILSPTTYYFVISVHISKTLLIMAKTSKVVMSTTDTTELGVGEIIRLSIFSLFASSLILHIICHLCLLRGSKIEAFASKKKVKICSVLSLMTLFISCVVLLFIFGIFVSDQCFATQATLDNVLDAVLVISCLGTTFIVIIWISVGYSVWQNQRSQKVCVRLQVNESYRLQSLHPAQSPAPADKEGKFQELIQLQKLCTENVKYDHISFDVQMGAYDILEHSTRNSVLQSVDTTGHWDETYSRIEDPGGARVQHGSTYDQLRPGEKSKPVPNMANPNYSHIGKRQPEPDLPDILYSNRVEKKRDDYDVLDQDHGRASFVSVPRSSVSNSFYSTLDGAAIEPRVKGSGVYNQLRPGKKSKAVPNMDDPNYSHVHVEDEQPEVVKKNPKRRVFKKTK